MGHAVLDTEMKRRRQSSTFPVQVFIDDSLVRDMNEGMFRTDSSSSRVTVTDTGYTRGMHTRIVLSRSGSSTSGAR